MPGTMYGIIPKACSLWGEALAVFKFMLTGLGFGGYGFGVYVGPTWTPSGHDSTLSVSKLRSGHCL